MTREQGKPLKAAMNEVKYAADFLQWFGEEAKRVYGETIPSARSDQRFLVQKQAVGGCRHHPLELPHIHADPKTGTRPCRRLHRGFETRRGNTPVCPGGIRGFA